MPGEHSPHIQRSLAPHTAQYIIQPRPAASSLHPVLNMSQYLHIYPPHSPTPRASLHHRHDFPYRGSAAQRAWHRECFPNRDDDMLSCTRYRTSYAARTYHTQASQNGGRFLTIAQKCGILIRLTSWRRAWYILRDSHVGDGHISPN